MNPEHVPDPLSTPMLNLPTFDIPERDPLSWKMTWEEVTEETEEQRQFYMKHYDSPERRLRDKNPKPFRLH